MYTNYIKQHKHLSGIQNIKKKIKEKSHILEVKKQEWKNLLYIWVS